MSKTIQIRHVPDDVHRTIKNRASLAGLSLSDYLLREIERFARQPTLEEAMSRIRRAGTVSPEESSAEAVRAERDAR